MTPVSEAASTPWPGATRTSSARPFDEPTIAEPRGGARPTTTSPPDAHTTAPAPTVTGRGTSVGNPSQLPGNAVRGRPAYSPGLSGVGAVCPSRSTVAGSPSTSAAWNGVI